MIEFIKAILIAIGFLVAAYMFSLLLTYCAESVGNWRKMAVNSSVCANMNMISNL